MGYSGYKGIQRGNKEDMYKGNYSCQGRNKAGWGATSTVRELWVLYPPKGANLTQHHAVVSKGSPFRVRRDSVIDE